MVLLLESGVFGPSFKEVFECSLLVSKALLERHTGDFIKPLELARAFDSGQFGVCLDVTDFFLFLIESIGTPAKDVVIDEARTAERLGKQDCLFSRGVETVFVGAFSHASHIFEENVNIAIT
ncbi:MAG: hypothetical protein ACRCZA_05145 [Shewanella sp.]|uniref:hypothetical protein n=1 Tax=Shewanella sp. TaxID=50422 RepID=UPI003F2D2FA4